MQQKGPFCFAKTTPENKKAIVKAFKESFVVAMVGDNGNDADALMCANIGFAVGKADAFVLAAAKVHAIGGWAGIVEGISIARASIDTVGLAGLMVADNVAILVTYIVGLYKFGSQFTIIPAFMAVLNFVVDGFPTYMLSQNPVSKWLMTVPPPAKDAPLVNKQDVPRYIVNALLIVTGSLYLFATHGDVQGAIPNGPETYMLSFQIMNKLMHLVSNVSRELVFEVAPWRNPYLIAGVVFNIFVFLAAMYWSIANSYIGLAPLNAEAWLTVGIAVALCFAADQAMKVIMRSAIIASPAVKMAIVSGAVAVAACVLSEMSGV